MVAKSSILKYCTYQSEVMVWVYRVTVPKQVIIIKHNDQYRCSDSHARFLQLGNRQYLYSDVKFARCVIKRNPFALSAMPKAPDWLKLEAVRLCGHAIRYITAPSELIKLAAVSQTGFAIKHIYNPSEAVQMAAVKQTGFAIKHIETPSEAVQIAAMSENGYALDHLDGPSRVVVDAALKQNPRSIVMLKVPSLDTLVV